MEPANNGSEVLIVGAGPTGLLTALLLTRMGIKVRVFDKNTQQAHESRALGVQARTMEIFLSLGLERAMLDRAMIVRGARMYENGQQRAEIGFDDLGRTDTPFSFVMVVPQSDTEAVLNDELRRLGVEVERQTEVTGIAQDADGVTVHARQADGTTFDATGKYLVGADGAHSVVRKALGLKFDGAAYAQGFLLADCRVDWNLGHERLMIFLHGKRLGIHFPLPGGEGRGRVMAMDLGDGDTHAPVEKQGGTDVPLEVVQTAFREATAVDVTLSEPSWTSRYRVHHRGVDRYRVGRTFVAGDAAHIHSPAGAQGMNTGLQDAANLAWKLALALRGFGVEALLDSYHAERFPVGRRVLEYTDRLFSAMTTQSDWLTALRNVVVPRVAGTLLQLDAVRQKAFHFVSELGIHYEPGATVADEARERETEGGGSHGDFWKHGPATGHRAPNALYGRNRDVFGLLEGYGFRVLAFSREEISAAEATRVCAELAALPSPPAAGLRSHLIGYPAAGNDERVLRAESSEVFKTYGLDHATPRALYLVRPDGYVAWRAAGWDLSGITAFLRERFGG